MRKRTVITTLIIAIATLNCNNLFHEIPSSGESAGSSTILSAGVHYVYPKNNFSNVPLNTKVLVAFATDMDITTVTSDSIQVEDAIGPVSGSLEFHGDRIVLFKPDVNFSNYTQYAVTLKSGMRDKTGQVIMHDYTFKYVTGEHVDTTAPVVEITSPAENSMVGVSEKYVSAKFNKDIDPKTLTTASFLIQEGINALPGRVVYDASLRTAYFFMDDALANYTTYTATLQTVVADLCGNTLSMQKSWGFRTGLAPVFVSLEPASNENNGIYTFGNISGTGRILRNADGSRIDSSYMPGQSLADIVDLGTEGAFGNGKSFRVVVNGFNLADAIRGLGLAPRYMNFIDGVINPPLSECYIDLYRGLLVLPRPIYWSRCESIGNLTNAEIGVFGPYVTGSFMGASGVKFGNGVYNFGPGGYGFSTMSGSIYPKGNDIAGFDAGTLSFWGMVSSDATAGYFTVSAYQSYLNGNISLTMETVSGGSWYDRMVLYVNGSAVVTYGISRGVVYHVYMIWDRSRGLQDGKSIRVFVNGVEAMSSSVVFNSTVGQKPYVTLYGSQANWDDWGGASAHLDNLVIWDHVVSENPSWLYNGGVGRENALHYMYGAPDYRPKLTGPNNGVGYYYLP
ncbi:MAG TPA: Ig-like domain-containing protein [Spirochaetota bacterium]|nr:Ig-like domain-containing protein [Spirochaetota bacterium]